MNDEDLNTKYAAHNKDIAKVDGLCQKQNILNTQKLILINTTNIDRVVQRSENVEDTTTHRTKVLLSTSHPQYIAIW